MCEVKVTPSSSTRLRRRLGWPARAARARRSRGSSSGNIPTILPMPCSRPKPEAEDLVAAAVGEHRAVPAHELVQAAKLGHQLGAGAQVEVVGVAEDGLSAECRDLVRLEALDSRLGADHDEGRRLDDAVRRDEPASAGPATRDQDATR